jgi:outer membrane biosynthesis protein TonB
MSKSGLADSPFFTTPVKVEVNPPADTPLPEPKKVQPVSPLSTKKDKPKAKTVSAKKVEKTATRISSNPDSLVSRTQDEIFELVRKACKEIGKEAATHRFTVAEKRHIAEIVYTYQTQGIKTTENEIARIAINFLIEDYKTNGENSILDHVLKALNR